MAKGISLHVGLNKVDRQHYNGWEGKLRACEADARAMEGIARVNGYSTNLLLTAQADSQSVINAIADASQKLQSGDIFFFTYSGHGGQVPDSNGGDEDDGLDETWVLYDRMLIDDELFTQWVNFKPGVRIFVLSDSCHSGTVLRAMPPLEDLEPIYENFSFMSSTHNNGDDGEEFDEFRIIPDDVQREVYFQNQSLYQNIQARNPQSDKSAIGASLLLISGCQDNQLSKDGVFNGLFTSTLLSVWNNGTFAGNYEQFYKEIRRRMPPIQTPNLFKTGASLPTFAVGKPFVIDENFSGGGGIVKPDVLPAPTTTGNAPTFAERKGYKVSINIEVK